jgi:serine/threonine protein kinase
MTGRGGSTGDEPEPTAPGEADESVPGYRDLVRIGHGGFSVVYRAVQESFERAVALKVLTVGPDEDARRRFQREVRLASRLSGHPHVVTVLDTGITASGRPYLAMDLYDGGSMRERLKKLGPLSAGETAMVGAKIAEALAAAHSLDVLHRDVTPNNILVSKFGEPALADFGVSCLLDSSSSASVLDVFSPQHAAPELMTKGVPTASSDVYALGSTLYQLLAGRPPFGGEGRDVRSIMWRAMNEPPPRPECPDVPGLADAIVRAMAKEPEDRFPDAAGFARTLRALIPHGTPATLPVPDLASAALAADAVATDRKGAASHDGTGGTGSGTGAGTGADTGAGTPQPAPDHHYDGGTSGNSLRSSDETMLRPDRADPDQRPAAPPGKRGPEEPGGSRSRVRRAKVPLILAAAVCLIGIAVWAMVAPRDPSTGSADAVSSHHAAVHSAGFSTPTGTPTPTPSASQTDPPGAASASPTGATMPAGAASDSTAPAPNSSSSLISLIGSYYQLQNAQTGDCLTQPSGASTAAQQGCASSRTESWEYSLSLGGVLAAPSGEFELVNEQSGLCLTASNGQVGAQSCGSGDAQLWSTVAAGGSSDEFRNAGDGQCLQAGSGSAVADGTCSASSQADLWARNGAS